MSAGYLAKCSSRGKPKEKFTTQTAAEGRRRSLIYDGVWTAQGSNTYFCNQCGGWHAGQVGVRNRGQAKKTAKNTPRHLDTQ